jgi:magnesium chelatase family protein
MVGPPGAGKTMLARRLPTILPPLTRKEALEVTRLHSVAGVLVGGGLVEDPPFRAPHHSISAAGMLGGGSGFLRPGEVSLAKASVPECPLNGSELRCAWSPVRLRIRGPGHSVYPRR